MCLHTFFTKNKVDSITNTSSNNKNAPASTAAALVDAPPKPTSGTKVPAHVDIVLIYIHGNIQEQRSDRNELWKFNMFEINSTITSKNSNAPSPVAAAFVDAPATPTSETTVQALV